MRIGIDCRMYSTRFTGIGRYVFELTENLFRLDAQNEYVLFFNEPEYGQFTPPRGNIKKVAVNAPHYSFSEQVKFFRILYREKIDVMHFTHFNAPIFYRKPSVVTIHDLTLSFYPGKKMNNPLHHAAYNITLKSAINNAKKVIAVSRHTKKDLQNLFRIPEEKIQVIYEGVDENFQPLKNEHLNLTVQTKYGIRPPYILYTGVWRSHKNLPNLIKSFSILKKDYLFDGSLVITGRHDPLYAPEIFQLTSSLGLDRDVIFTGMVPDSDLLSLYAGASVYAFPSLYEGFGLSPLEAMQCGIPVAASNASCIPEICGKENALYFDPLNPDDIAEKQNTILIDSSVRNTLIKNGHNHVKKFSWEKMAEETLFIYKQLSNA